MTQHLFLNRLRAFRQQFWYIGDLIVIGLLSAYIAYVHSLYSISYHAGLHHNGATRFAATMNIGMLLPLVAILLLVLIYRLLVSWSEHIRDAKRRWKLRGLVLALLSLYAGLFFAAIRSSAEGFALGLLRYGQTSVDVPAIQTWLKTVDPEDCWGDRLSIYIEGLPEAEQATWPQAIKSLKPQLVRLYLDAAHRPIVRLEWGGWDEAYGIAIGSSDWQIPETGTRPDGITEESAFYIDPDSVRPLAPGAYIWYYL